MKAERLAKFVRLWKLPWHKLCFPADMNRQSSLPSRLLGCPLVLLLAIALAPTVQAQEGPQPGPPSTRQHDGFYLRLSTGLTFVHVASSATRGDEDVDASLNGWGLSQELSVGGTLGSGLVLGGQVSLAQINNTDISGERTLFGEDASFDISMIGPFLDWYPSLEHGGHLGVMLGYGAFSMPDDDDAIFDASTAAVFGGYDFWVSDSWSIGALGRCSYYSTQHDVGGENDDKALGFALELTAVYH